MPAKNQMKNRIKAVENAMKLHAWPEEGPSPSERDMAIFNKLQDQRAFEAWPPSDLYALANLAVLQADFNEQQEALREEGHIVLGGKNGDTQIENPRNRVCATLLSAINMTSRRLGIAASTIPDRKTQGVAAQTERNIKAKLKDEQKSKHQLI